MFNRRESNPKYWATGHAEVDIATSQNPFALIRAEESLQIITNHHVWAISWTVLKVRNLSNTLNYLDIDGSRTFCILFDIECNSITFF
jgi:hypothetical protein